MQLKEKATRLKAQGERLRSAGLGPNFKADISARRIMAEDIKKRDALKFLSFFLYC